MEFHVTYTGGETTHYGAEANYKVSDQGLLVIRDGAGKQVTLPAHAWSRLEEDVPGAPTRRRRSTPSSTTRAGPVGRAGRAWRLAHTLAYASRGPTAATPP